MKAPNGPDCPKFLTNVARMIDGRMKPAEEEEFIASLKDNNECLNKLKIEQSYKTFLANKLERKCCSDSLIQCIKEKVETSTSSKS